MKETVNFTTKTSRWTAVNFLGSKWMLILLGLIVLAIAFMIIAPMIDAIPVFEYTIFIVYGLGGLYLLIFIFRALGIKRERVDVLDERLIVTQKNGWTTVRTIVPIRHITMFEVKRSFLGCLFKFGSVRLYNVSGAKIHLESMGRVNKFQDSFYAQLLTHWVEEPQE